MREAAAGNALSPTVDSRVGGTISADVDDDLSLCLELISATRRIQKLHIKEYRSFTWQLSPNGRWGVGIGAKYVAKLINNT